MNFVNQYALLFAVAIPVVAIVGIQVYLFLCGERDTLLVPGLNRYPSIAYNKDGGQVATQVAPVTFSESAATAEPSNEEMERQAA